MNHFRRIKRWRPLILGHNNKRELSLRFIIQFSWVGDVSSDCINGEISQRISFSDKVPYIGVTVTVSVCCLVEIKSNLIRKGGGWRESKEGRKEKEKEESKEGRRERGTERKEGRNEGRREGRKEGMSQGRKEGENENRRGGEGKGGEGRIK